MRYIRGAFHESQVGLSAFYFRVSTIVN